MVDERDKNAIDPPDNTGGTGKADMDSSSDEEANAIDPPDNTGGGTES